VGVCCGWATLFFLSLPFLFFILIFCFSVVYIFFEKLGAARWAGGKSFRPAVGRTTLAQACCLHIIRDCLIHMHATLEELQKHAGARGKLDWCTVFPLHAQHEDGSCVCDQCPGEDEHVQNEVHFNLPRPSSL